MGTAKFLVLLTLPSCVAIYSEARLRFECPAKNASELYPSRAAPSATVFLSVCNQTLAAGLAEENSQIDFAKYVYKLLAVRPKFRMSFRGLTKSYFKALPKRLEPVPLSNAVGVTHKASPNV
jgi:hypothetical protein